MCSVAVITIPGRLDKGATELSGGVKKIQRLREERELRLEGFWVNQITGVEREGRVT